MKKNVNDGNNSTSILTVNDYHPNDVLITNTMLKSVSACTRQDKIEVGHLFDLANLSEAMILHDRLLIHPYDSPLEENESLYKTLSDEGILYNTHPVDVKTVNLKAMDLVKYVLSDEYEPTKKDEMIKKTEIILNDDIRKWDNKLVEDQISPNFRNKIFDPSNIKPFNPDYFYDAAHYFLSHHSTSLNMNIVWDTHVLTYWVLWDNLSISYYPSFDRLQLTALLNQKFHSSLTEKAYRVVADSLDSTVAGLKEYLSPFATPIPYVLSIILNKASKPEDIIELMLEERHKSRKFREVFTEYEYSIKNAKTLNDALNARKKVNEAITVLSKATEIQSTKYFNEILSFSEALIAPIVNPLDPKSYSHSLITMPVESLKHWWTKRKVIYMFSFVKKAKQIKPLIENANRIWAQPITEEQIGALPKYLEQIIKLKK